MPDRRFCASGSGRSRLSARRKKNKAKNLGEWAKKRQSIYYTKVRKTEELKIPVPTHSVPSSAEKSELSLDNSEGFDEPTPDTNALPDVKIEDISNESEIVYNSSTIEISHCTTESTEEKRREKLKTVENDQQEEEEESYTVLKTANNRDGCSIFGEHVASEIRKLRPKPQAIVKHLISNILFEAAMGKYDSPSQQAYYSNTSVSINDSAQQFQTGSSATQGMAIIPVYINEDESVSNDCS